MQAFIQGMASRKSSAVSEPKLKSILRESFRTAFVPDAIKETILAELKNNLTAEEVGSTLAWIQTPLGKKITKIEEAASSPDVQKKLPQFVANLRKEPPAPDRLSAVQRLDRATNSTKTLVKIVMTGQLAMLVGVSATLPEEKKLPLSALISKIEKSRPMLERAMKSQILVMFLYTYKSLKNSELVRYLEFLETGVGVRFNDAVFRGLNKALVNSMEKFGTALGNALKGNKI